jgi:hypothetical protein
MDIVNQAKNVGAVLGTATIVSYVFGYLAHRARAHALGIDPISQLVDEAYVFMGFRLLLTTLILLFLSTPILLLARWSTLYLSKQMSPGVLQGSQWLLLFAMALLTVVAIQIVGTNGVLLKQDPLPEGGIAGAVLGQAVWLQILLNLAVVAVTILSALWLHSRLSRAVGPFELVLATIVAAQLCLVPIYHGALLADRKVWELAAVPKTVKRLETPLGIVNRTPERVTLFGLDDQGQRRLTTIKLDDLNGVPIRQVLPLHAFIESIRQHQGAAPRSDKDTGNPVGTPSSPNVQSRGGFIMVSAGTEQVAKKDFFDWLAEYLRITLEGVGALGESVHSGELWVVDLDGSGRPGTRRRIGTADDLAWPVAGPSEDTYYALQRGRAVQIDAESGNLQQLETETIWRKLLGVLGDGTLLGLVTQAGETRPAMLRPSGQLEIDTNPLSKKAKDGIAHLLQETRTHRGGATLKVERSERGGRRGFDVLLEFEQETFNLSDCGDEKCGQPSLAPDFSRALYIREPRF